MASGNGVSRMEPYAPPVSLREQSSCINDNSCPSGVCSTRPGNIPTVCTEEPLKRNRCHICIRRLLSSRRIYFPRGARPHMAQGGVVCVWGGSALGPDNALVRQRPSRSQKRRHRNLSISSVSGVPLNRSSFIRSAVKGGN